MGSWFRSRKTAGLVGTSVRVGGKPVRIAIMAGKPGGLCGSNATAGRSQPARVMWDGHGHLFKVHSPRRMDPRQAEYMDQAKVQTSRKAGSSQRVSIMGNENAVSGSNTIPPDGRPVTRASSKLITSSVVTATSPNQGRVLSAKTKRTALDDKNANAPKKRAVFKDITNLTCENSYRSCFNIKRERASSSKVASSSATSQVTNKKVEVVSNSGGGSLPGCTGRSLGDASYRFIPKLSLRLPLRPIGTCEVHKRSANEACVSDSFAVERSRVGASSSVASSSKIIDIDSDDKEPLRCSLYAPDIHYNMRVAELIRRPSPDFMEITQRDVTPTMRRILVGWLVEVSEEYTFVPDTLYLTVYLIDWFLHGNYVERQRLQLLGVTCLLIASKYEEICAPRIKDLCFITDNSYTTGQVVEMEIQVVKHFSFKIYSPTSKTFLRRFLQAAQASSYLSPSLELEFLANYLTELTLIVYDFLKYLPSLIAASAVFLAKWTLNQSRHPWNPTLEHYTTYKASDLKTPVHDLQDLQRNTNDCSLNSIRMKYRQEKFKSVAVLISADLPDKLFIS